MEKPNCNKFKFKEIDKSKDEVTHAMVSCAIELFVAPAYFVCIQSCWVYVTFSNPHTSFNTELFFFKSLLTCVSPFWLN